MRKAFIFLLVFLVLLGAPTAIRYFQFYDTGAEEVSPPPDYDPDVIAEVSEVPIPVSREFVDDPEVGEGNVLLDVAHANEFTLEEISYLDGRLAARGFEMIPYRTGDLATQLRGVNAFIVITPIERYDEEEVQAVQDFVDRGGRLLMIGDPTRFAVVFDETDFSFTYSIEKDDISLNTLANAFNIAFNGDYLYNTVENEGNFRNIILQGTAFAEDRLTDGLEEIAFYSAHSLQVGPDAEALLLGDDNTWSSATDRPGGLVLGATSMNGRVLALGDIHFMIEPYYTVFDNGRFIAQIADFLAEASSRGFVLADFPYFYRHPIDLVYTGSPDFGPDAFDEIIALQDAFRRVDRDLQLVAAPDSDHDVLYLGLFNQTTEIAEILASEGISLTIEPPVLTADEEEALAAEEDAETEPADEEVIDQETIAADDIADDMDTMRLIQSGWGNVQMSGTALILLHETGAQRSVVVLAASADGLENTVNRILELIPLNADYALSDCLVQDNLALCPTNVANEVVEAELLSGGQPDDTGNQGGTSSGGGDDIGGGFMPPVDADFQGFIGLDDSVSGSLGENEAHSWVFRDGPATIDIVMESDDLDGVLELYNPDGDYITSADSGLSGDSEAIEGITIEDDGEYTIVVRDFWGEVGDYTLSVTEAAAAPETGDNGGGGNRVFILADDDGEALNGGFTSVDFFASQLSADYDVTVWVTSVDGRLEFDTLDGVDLLIWDTGDYQDPEGFLDEDTTVIFNYLDAGEGDILIVGSAPVLFSYLDATPLSDLEVAGGDPILLNGLQVGDIIDLDQTYATISPDVVEGDIGEEDTLFLLRGPASEDAGAAVAVASSNVNEDGQKLALLAFPFTALPEDIQDILLANLLDWFAQN